MIDLLEATAFGAAIVYGFRHGFDWDHLAALTDLTGSQTTSKRSMWLATLYALGHAVMVLVLGVVVIVFAEKVPASVDGAMERLVGVSLLAFGTWLVWSVAHGQGAPPLRSRWMLLIDGARRLAGRRRHASGPIVIEHSHPHDHEHALHDHPHALAAHAAPSDDSSDVVVQHTHVHRHVAIPPQDPFVRYSSSSSLGVGLLHGVGAETPTQVLVFATAANATARPTSIALLVCFVVGLVVSNTLVAAASTFGFGRVLRRPRVRLGLAVVTAAFSLVVGTLLLAGAGSFLPPMLGE